MIEVSKHAELRYRQRIDPREPFPREKIEQLLDQGEPDSSADVAEGIAYRAGEAVLVVKDRVVTTVLHRATDE